MGTLLAQVIPVLALALGIELRSAARQIRADRRDGTPSGPTPSAAYYGVFIAVVLAAGEQLSIAAAAGVKDLHWDYLWATSIIPNSGLLGSMLTISIIGVFLTPAYEVIGAMMPLAWPDYARRFWPFWCTLALGIVALVLPVVM
jgi:hypothetical protein